VRPAEEEIARQMRLAGLGRVVAPPPPAPAGPKKRRSRIKSLRQAAASAKVRSAIDEKGGVRDAMHPYTKTPLPHTPHLALYTCTSPPMQDDDGSDSDSDDGLVREEHEFRNSDVVGDYAYAYGHEGSPAARKELKEFDDLFQLSPKHRKGPAQADAKADDKHGAAPARGGAKGEGKEGKGGGSGSKGGGGDDEVAPAKGLDTAAVEAVEAGLHRLDALE